MEITLIQVVLISLIYALFHGNGGLPPIGRITTMVTPFTFSWLIGAVLGDWKQGLIIGATIQTINMTPVIIGGITTVDLWYSATLVIPLVISYGLDITAAVAIAAPVAVIANFLGQINIIGLFDLVYVPLGDKAAAEGNWKKLLYVSHVLPAVLNTAFKFVVAFMGVYAGTAATSLIINKIPESVMLGFGAAAGLMPAVGFAMFLALIGKMKFLPYFFVGFYLVKFAGLSTIVIGLIGLILGFIYMLNREGMNDSENLIGGN